MKRIEAKCSPSGPPSTLLLGSPSAAHAMKYSPSGSLFRHPALVALLLLLLAPAVLASCTKECTPNVFVPANSQCMADCVACESRPASGSCIYSFDAKFSFSNYIRNSCNYFCWRWWMWIVVGVGTFLVIATIAVITFCIIRRQKANRAARMEAAAAQYGAKYPPPEAGTPYGAQYGAQPQAYPAAAPV